MAMPKNVKCPECDRRFSMPAHLGRHMNTVHKAGGRKAKSARRGRRPTRRSLPATGLAAAISSLVNLSLGQLCRLIDEARAEATRRLAQF